MATCTDNSTECLLQKVVAALEQANSVYNWNPVTFAVTVVIGVIALWFALLPVLQGILFPPDRVKYSWSAIGNWSELVYLSWNWADMSYLAILQTPVLDFESIASHLASQDIELYGTESVSSKDRPVKKRTPTDQFGANKSPETAKETQDSKRRQQHSGDGLPDIEAAIGKFLNMTITPLRKAYQVMKAKL